MDGIHDLGGKHGYGEVDIDQYPPGFVERWHGAVFSMVNSAFVHGAIRNTDHFRHAVERIDPVSYLSDGYYGRWLGGLETLFVESGHLSQQEVTTRAAELGADANARIAAQPDLEVSYPAEETNERTSSAARELTAAPLYRQGDKVRTSHRPSVGHTRLPAYVRGAIGTVVAHQGAWVLPDAAAHGPERADHLYNVCFTARDLYGESADPGSLIHIDLFESYLQGEAADE